jgi:hypothetical protein
VVCQSSNKGWMSSIESAAIPILGSLIEGLVIDLNQEQQATIARWPLKTAMVFESQRPPDPDRFYATQTGASCEPTTGFRRAP